MWGWASVRGFSLAKRPQTKSGEAYTLRTAVVFPYPIHAKFSDT